MKLVKEGKIEFTKEGKIIGFNEHAIFLPVRVMNKLYLLLREKISEENASEILKELGKYQVKQALTRYIKTLGWDEIEKQKAIEFSFKFLSPSLGLGVFKVFQEGEKILLSIDKTPFAEEFVLEYGKQQKSIDYYIAGLWEETFTRFLEKPMICEEVKCYAKGDECCEFVVKPKEETK
ncbi:MAG: 4-vinyl reductase [Candidatus Aenigmarchaeota archaeon]|nr:4-vinyl reductase [Candidatus Aenigmarchaeota archaeon]